MGVAFGVDRDLQLLKAVVLAAGNSPVGIHYLVDEFVLTVIIFGFGIFPVTDMGISLAVTDEIFHHASIAPCMHTAGILSLTFIFPMEGHAPLVGKLYQQVSAGIDEMLADIQRVNGFHHVAPVIVTVTDQLHLLTVLMYGYAEYPSRLVGFHLQEFSP